MSHVTDIHESRHTHADAGVTCPRCKTENAACALSDGAFRVPHAGHSECRMRCIALQRTATRCNTLQHKEPYKSVHSQCRILSTPFYRALCVALCCSVSQCVAVKCSACGTQFPILRQRLPDALHCTATHSNTLQHTATPKAL